MSLTYIIAVSFLNKIHLIPSWFDEFDERTQGFESPWFLIDDNTNWIAATLRVINVGGEDMICQLQFTYKLPDLPLRHPHSSYVPTVLHSWPHLHYILLILLLLI